MNSKLFWFCIGCLLISSCARRPIANFSVVSEDNVAPADFTFIDSSINADEYEWEFEDGERIQNEDAKKRFTLSGRYKVKLIAKKGKKKHIMEKEIDIKAPQDCLVEIETPFGTMVAKLYDETPLHRDNFVKLAGESYYDDLLFHRVIKGFMVQGGDPNSKGADQGASLGSGGPGYQVDAEFVEGLVHKKGALAAARMGDGANPEKKSSGSQFYIVHGRALDDNQIEQMEIQKGIHYPPDVKSAYKEHGGAPFLDGEYTVFGEVIEGLDIIDKIAEVETDRGDRPAESVTMKIRVIK